MPKNLKPISCEGFNDVPTIYWHLLNDCNEIGVKANYLCDTIPSFGYKVLLIEGWGRKKGNYIIFCPDSVSAAAENVEKASNYVNLYLNWPVSEGVIVDNSIDYYHILCREIWHYKPEHGVYRIELNGAILYFEDTTGKYIIKGGR